ncbi:MAG: hypothetical protein R3B90_06705 [Planctomycetaceae bacterium]
MQLTQSRPSPILPSAQRPVPMRRRHDVVVAEIRYRGVLCPVLKDPCGIKYFRLQPEQFHVFEMLDGRRSLEEIRDEVQLRFPTTQ